MDSSHLQPLHSYPSVPSGWVEIRDPYERPRRGQKAPWQLFPTRPSERAGSKHNLLSVPSEIRLHILQFVLPNTTIISKGGSRRAKEIYWRCGCTTVLAANKQLYEECSKLMYGNAFEISACYDKITFLFRRLLQNGLAPKKTPMFLETIKPNYWRLLRHVRVHIHVENEYMGMIKYNTGGRGLPIGVQKQVKQLVEMLQHAEQLKLLEVILENSRNDKVADLVLQPFLELHNVSCSTWTGDVTAELAEQLSEALSRSP